MPYITEIYAKEVLDSKGIPTVKVEVYTESGASSGFLMPSDYTDEYMTEARDKNDKRYNGLGVNKAIDNINRTIAKTLIGEDVREQLKIDKKLNQLDNLSNKSKIGSNTLMSLSLAVSIAAANYSKLSLYRYLGGARPNNIPLPVVGLTECQNLGIECISVSPSGFNTYKDAIKASSEVRYALLNNLNEPSSNDYGYYKYEAKTIEEALDLVVKSITDAGYNIKNDFLLNISFDPDKFYDKEKKGYVINDSLMSVQDYSSYLEKLSKTYSLLSISDPIIQGDYDAYKKLTKRLNNKTLVILDKYAEYSDKKLERFIKENDVNGLTLNLTRFSTLSDFMKTYSVIRNAGLTPVITSARGENNDSYISSLSLALNVPLVNFGGLDRMERVIKYNELSEIEADSYNNIPFTGKKYR